MTRSRTLQLFAAVLSAVALVSTTAASAASSAHSRSSGGYGVVAVHTGSWGYKELVFGKATTQQIANSPVWDVTTILLSAAGSYGIDGALVAYLIKWRAQDAVNSGQCFALVRPIWGSPNFPGKESWGCY